MTGRGRGGEWTGGGKHTCGMAGLEGGRGEGAWLGGGGGEEGA